MLFNSAEFIFVFLPLTLLGFFLIGSSSRSWALAWLIGASVFFYAWWRPANVAIMGPALLLTYLWGRLLLRLAADGGRGRLATAVLMLAIAAELAFLGYFKYANFFVTAANDLTGSEFVLQRVILPLGISFITFQKIAFLIDVHGRRIESFTFREYALFILFFPQLIAGPIVHFREVVPQFRQLACRFDAQDLAVGLTLFVIGLFKKVVLADGIAVHVSPLYEAAAAGAEAGMVAAWVAAVGFTLQIYFDFSGYSDMALGLARCFGLRLPANFDSPLKATNIIDFWARWHMTLTRFLTAYLYNPLVLWLTRRRLARGLPTLGGRRASPRAFMQLLAVPTMLTMFCSGLWHGAGYLFVLWGLLHGVYLVINHAWRLWLPRFWPAHARHVAWLRPAGAALTFVAVAVAMVLFRAQDIAAANQLLQGMLGLHGLVGADDPSLRGAVARLAVLLAIALLLPNSLQLLQRHSPALGTSGAPPAPRLIGAAGTWSMSWPWAFAISTMAAVAVSRLAEKTEFLYWQF